MLSVEPFDKFSSESDGSEEKRMRLLMLSLLGMPTLALGAAPVSIDGAKSRACVLVNKADTVLSGFAHDHVICASGVQGTVEFDNDTAQCTVEVSVAVSELVVDDPALRKALGVEGEIKEGDRKTIKKHMLATKQLDAQKHPKVLFRSARCGAMEAGFWAEGQLTIKGKNRPQRIELSRSGAVLVGRFSILGSDFGLAPYSAFLGAVKNQDRLRFDLRLTPLEP